MSDAPPSASGVQYFNWADYLVLGVYLVLLTVIGFIVAYRERHNVSSKNFLTGGRSMHWFPVALSMQGSMISAISMLSIPADMYNYGTMYYFIVLSFFAAYPISAHMYLPIFYKLRLISCYEYLERRFNRSARLAGSLTWFIMIILYLSVVLYTPAIALAQVTGLGIGLSVVISGVICTLYTIMGGLKATIWTDLLQMTLLLIGYVVIIIIGCIRVGGISEAFSISQQGGRIIFNEFTPNPTTRSTFYSQLMGGTFIYLTYCASNQAVSQKFSSVTTLRNAKKSVWMLVFTSVIYLTLVCLIGIIMYAYYVDCDPLILDRIKTPDQLLPLFVMDIMGNLHGLPGFFMATVFSAALSTTSGCLNALTAITIADYLPPLYALKSSEPMSEKAKSILTRILVLIFGIFTICMGYVAQYFGDSVNQIALSIYGFVGGPLTAMVTLGVFLPFINSLGAILGLLGGLIISSWVAIGTILQKIPPLILPLSADNCTSSQNITDFVTTANMTTSSYDGGFNYDDVLWIYRVSYMHYSFIAFVTVFVIAIPVSLLTGRAKNVDRSLVYSFRRSFCKPCRRKCGEQFEEEDSQSVSSSSSTFTKEKRIIDEIHVDGYSNGGQTNEAADTYVSEF